MTILSHNHALNSASPFLCLQHAASGGDIDATLQELMDNRLVWNEARFCFVQERDKNLGGNSLFRSEERIATDKRYLKRKWKAHIRLEKYKSQDRVSMDAPRRQSVKV